MSSRITVGLIDDHQLFRQSVGAWLAAEGQDIDVVASVRTVEEFIHSPGRDAAVVLLDLRLADDSSVEDNLGALRERSRVVVVSANAEPAVVQRALLAGAMGYVPKAASAEEMLAAIRSTATGSTYMTQELALALIEHHPAERPRLSRQELRTLQWYAGGLPMKSVARRLDVSEGAVKSYVDRIREKYEKAGREAPTKVDLYRRAVEDGYLSMT